MMAGEDTTTRGADKPRTIPTDVAGRLVQENWIALIFQILPILVGTVVLMVEDYPVRFGAYLDGSDNFTIRGPSPVECAMRYQ